MAMLKIDVCKNKREKGREKRRFRFVLVLFEVY